MPDQRDQQLPPVHIGDTDFASLLAAWSNNGKADVFPWNGRYWMIVQNNDAAHFINLRRRPEKTAAGTPTKKYYGWYPPEVKDRT